MDIQNTENQTDDLSNENKSRHSYWLKDTSYYKTLHNDPYYGLIFDEQRATIENPIRIPCSRPRFFII